MAAGRPASRVTLQVFSDGWRLALAAGRDQFAAISPGQVCRDRSGQSRFAPGATGLVGGTVIA